MPTYEYLCTSCGHEWEFEQSIKDDALKVCEKCNQSTARRQISRGGGFILKGGGWYADLYSGGSNKQASSGDSGGSASTGSADAKPAAAATSGSSTSSDTSSSSTPAATPPKPSTPATP